MKILRKKGKEYINQAMNEFMKKKGIYHETTIAYTPEQNWVAERCNKTIMERCTIIEAADLNHKYWAEAVNTSVYLKKNTSTRAVLSQTLEA